MQTASSLSSRTPGVAGSSEKRLSGTVTPLFASAVYSCASSSGVTCSEPIASVSPYASGS